MDRFRELDVQSIEGIPVIIRFKTTCDHEIKFYCFEGIEGIPVIIRFKTTTFLPKPFNSIISIEGIPVIIRFKTRNGNRYGFGNYVLKVFQL